MRMCYLICEKMFILISLFVQLFFSFFLSATHERRFPKRLTSEMALALRKIYWRQLRSDIVVSIRQIITYFWTVIFQHSVILLCWKLKSSQFCTVFECSIHIRSMQCLFTKKMTQDDKGNVAPDDVIWDKYLVLVIFLVASG